MSDLAALTAILTNEWPVFGDCALPGDCECARRVRPEWGASGCMVPGINALAADLGWTIPYPHALNAGIDPP